MFHWRFSSFLYLLLLLLVALSGCQPSGGANLTPVAPAADEPLATAGSIPQTTGDETAFDCALVTELPAGECQALVAFYQATNGPAWPTRDGWLQTTTPCSWYGLACVDGHVDMVALFNNELQGPIPPALAGLTHLRVLDLHNNRLSGEIPAAVDQWSALESLDLSMNELSGPIPPTIGKLSKLRFLALTHNELQGALPAELGQLAALEYVDLCDNQLSGTIPESLAGLELLGTLRLNNNQFEGSIPFTLGELPAIRELDLTFNQLSGTVPVGVWQIPIHRLWGNQLEGTIAAAETGTYDVQFLDTGFTYDPALASSVWPEIEPALPLEQGPGTPWARPEHLSFTLVGSGEAQAHVPLGLYLPAEPQLHFFPTAALNEEVQPQVEALRQLLAERPDLAVYETPVTGATWSEIPALPMLPPSNALQVFRAQVEYLSFASGSGVRYLTQMAQGYSPINNEELFYTFQGMTDDGAQYVVLYYPVALPDLPATPAMSQVEFANLVENWDSYLPQTVQMLDAQPAAAFIPGLALLDDLVRSITITPAAAALDAVWPAAGEATGDMPILQWASFPGVDRYEVVVVDDDAFPPVVAFELTTTELMAPVTPALPPGSYSWTVRGLDAQSVVIAALNSNFTVK